MLEHLQFLPSEPLGTRYAYTNFGLTAAAVAVAEAAGSDWEFLSEQALYRPLGMKATSSRFSDFMSRTNRAYPHILVNGSFQLNPEQRQPDAQSPAGGVSSSVRDMARWMSLLLNEGKFAGQQFSARDALVPALSPQMLVAPSGSLAGLPFPSPPTTPPRGVGAYTGAYSNAYFENARIQGPDTDSLELIMGPAGAERRFPLSHWDGDVFVFEPGGEMAVPGSRSAVTFTIGAGGTADSLTIEIYQTNGAAATLTRRP